MSAYWFYISKNINKNIIHKIELYEVIKNVNPNIFVWKVYTKDNKIYNLDDDITGLTKEDQKILYKAKENNWKITEKAYQKLKDSDTVEFHI